MARGQPPVRAVPGRSGRRPRGQRPRDVRAPPRVAEADARGGLGRHRVAGGVRRPGRRPDRARHLGRGVRGGAGARPPRQHGPQPDRPDHHPLGHRRAEDAPSAPDPQRRRGLVPGLLRARRGIGPGQPADARRRAGRPLRRQRPEGLDLGRALRPLDHPARAHQPRRAEAPGHLLLPGPHGLAGHHRAPARAADRPSALQRGLLQRRRRPQGQPARARSTRAGRSRRPP